MIRAAKVAETLTYEKLISLQYKTAEQQDATCNNNTYELP